MSSDAVTGVGAAATTVTVGIVVGSLKYKKYKITKIQVGIVIGSLKYKNTKIQNYK